jgi:nucleoside phosphorylase
MLGRGLGLGVLVAVLTAVIAVPSAGAAQRSKPKPNLSCVSSGVLLLGSYPSEVSANLSREKLDPGQPTTVQGHEFYSGRLERRHVVLGIAGQSPADTYAITELALSRFSCISAVVFEGTAGGGGESGLADVTVPGRWVESDGQPFAHGHTSSNVSAKALAVAGSIAAKATSELGSTAAVDDGPCACSGLVDSLRLVPTMRTPRVIVGGSGETDNTGASDKCLPDGGMLDGCNPCPPGSTPATVQSGVTAGATTSAAAAKVASLATRDGVLVPNPAELLSRITPPPPPAGRAASTQSDAATGATYVADDQQTTASMLAAQAHQVPFIAFRGISDTTAVGNLWPFEWLVYQRLAADNAAVAARLWIGAWGVRAPGVGAASS